MSFKLLIACYLSAKCSVSKFNTLNQFEINSKNSQLSKTLETKILSFLAQCLRKLFL